MSGFTTKQRLLDRGVTDDYRLHSHLAITP
jgi:hypothetical protein